MNLELKFMPFGRALNATFSLYFRYFFVFTGLFLAGFAALIVVSIVPALSIDVYGSSLEQTLINYGIEFVYQVFVFGFIGGFAALIVSDAFLNRQVSYKASFTKSIRRYGRLSLIGALKTIFVGLPLFIGSLFTQFSSQRFFTDQGPVWVLLGVVFVLLGIAWFIISFPRFNYWTASAIIEDLGVGASLKKSWKLASANLGQNYGLFFTVYGIALGFVFILSTVLTVVLFASQMANGGMLQFTRLIGTIELVILVPFVALHEIGTTILYYNARVKKEHFGLAHLIDQFAQSSEPEDLD